MNEIFKSMSNASIQIMEDMQTFFRVIFVPDANGDLMSIGDAISAFLPDGVSWLGSIASFLLPWTLYEFLILSCLIWLAFIIVKFVVNLLP